MRCPEIEDLVAGAGVLLIGAGAWLQFGLGIALMVVGVLLVAGAVAGAIQSARQGP